MDPSSHCSRDRYLRLKIIKTNTCGDCLSNKSCFEKDQLYISDKTFLGGGGGGAND